MELRIVVLLTFLTVNVIGLSTFLDCPGNQSFWNIFKFRRCCTSDQLPKGCECYDISSNSEFTNSLLSRPQCPKDIDVRFLLYTRDNNVRHYKLKVGRGDTSIHYSPFKGSRPTKFITHGFGASAPDTWPSAMKKAFLDAEDVNVILVDWRKGARAPFYGQAVANTRTVGSMIARLIMELNELHDAAFESFHLIGHSLGSHASAIAGEEIERLTSAMLGRITGLDPAGPRFEGYSVNVRLDKWDASFVDIIHTDAEPFLSSGFGYRGAIGHVDFFPNGGKHQPGCPKEIGGILSILDITSERGTCSHSRSIFLFINSISKCRYDPPNGDSRCTMGYHVSTTCTGQYYPKTTGREPFC